MRFIILTLTLIGLAATPTAAAAQGLELLTPEGGLVIWSLLVFGLVVFIYAKYAHPHIVGAVEAREQALRDLQEEVKRDRAAAAELVEKQQKELEAAREKTQQILADSRESSEKAREEMLAETRREQEAMLDRTRRDIDAQMRRAIEEVRREAVVVAMAAAEKLIERNLDEADNRRIVEQYLSRLEDDRSPAAAGV